MQVKPYTISVFDAATQENVALCVHDVSAEEFAARLKKVAKVRRKWARKEGVFAYRVYDADLPNFSVAIDIYLARKNLDAEIEPHVVVTEYKAPKEIDDTKALNRLLDVVAIVPHVLGILQEHVFVKQRRRAKGGSQYGLESSKSSIAYIEEFGQTFKVDFTQHLDTGIFLDHRPIRKFIFEHAKNTTFLNLFAYTATASVHAAAGGAAQTVTVDMSNTYTAWARENMQINGFETEKVSNIQQARGHTIVKADCLQWLNNAQKSLESAFDLIFIDPPTFSNSSSMGSSSWDIQRDHVALLSKAYHLLAYDGLLIFSGNLRNFVLDSEALGDMFSEIRNITEESIPPDFERNKRIHFCYMLKK